MTVIVQQPTDSNGNPQPMVYDSDTGKIIVDSNGYYINGGKRLVNVPTKADYVNTPKTTSSGITEAFLYAESIAFYDTQYTDMYEYPKIQLGTGIFYISAAQTITTKKAAHSIIISGQGENNTRLVAQSSVGDSNYVFTLDIAGSPILQINDMSWYFESNTSQGMFDWEPNSTDNTAAGLNLFNIENGSASQKYLGYFGGSGLQNAYVQNIQNEGNTPLCAAFFVVIVCAADM